MWMLHIANDHRNHDQFRRAPSRRLLAASSCVKISNIRRDYELYHRLLARRLDAGSGISEGLPHSREETVSHLRRNDDRECTIKGLCRPIPPWFGATSHRTPHRWSFARLSARQNPTSENRSARSARHYLEPDRVCEQNDLELSARGRDHSGRPPRSAWQTYSKAAEKNGVAGAHAA